MSREGDVYKFNGFKEAVSVVCIAVRWPHPLLKSTCIGIESTVSLQLATKISSVKNLCACMHTCLSKFKVIQLYLGGGVGGKGELYRIMLSFWDVVMRSCMIN